MFWNFGETMGPLLKLVLFVLNTCLFGNTLFTSYLNFEDARQMSMNQQYFVTHKSLRPFILQISIYISYAIVNLYIFAFVQCRAKSILVFLYDMDIDIDSDIEKRIAIKSIFIQVTVTLIVSLLFFLCSTIFYGVKDKILYNCALLLDLILIQNYFFILISMMAYFCYTIQQKIKDLEMEFISNSKLSKIFKQLLIIQTNVKKIRQLYNQFLFIYFILLSFECLGSLTILYFDRLKTMPWPIAGIFSSLTQLFTCFYLSDRIDKSYVTLIDKYEQLQLLISERQLEQLNHCMVRRLYSMRDDMCFTAINLYRINMKTFLSILSSIITFAVILIQASDWL